jgi:hypothetical protein
MTSVDTHSHSARAVIRHQGRVSVKLRSVVALAACACALALTAPLANADQGYTDATGDANGAIDIGAVQVTNDGLGNVTFTIPLPAAKPLLTDSQAIEIDIDTDRNTSTGDKIGAEISMDIYGGDGEVSWDYGKWDGTKMDYDARSTTGGLRLGADSASITINRSELNDAQTFDFAVYSIQFTADAMTGTDNAPNNDSDWWTYAIENKNLVVKLSNATGKFPVGGAPWQVSTIAVGTTTDGVKQQLGAGTVQCVARIGTTRLKATGSWGGGVAMCTIKIPKKTSGKIVRGTIAVSLPGGQAATSFSKRIL